MNGKENSDFKYLINCGARVMLMLPFNVVMMGRVRGNISASIIKETFENLRVRHPLLAIRAHLESDDNGFFTTENVPSISVRMETRKNDDHWLDFVKEEFMTSFPLETGPLFRCTVVHSPELSEIILCGHHAICDGMSLAFLLRDLLQGLNNPKPDFFKPLDPPVVDRNSVPNSPPTNAIQRFVMQKINTGWAAKNIYFKESDRQKMHEVFWEQNKNMQLLAWSLDAEETAKLVERCREENVTVNSALWTAFLAAQSEIQTDQHRYRQRSAMAVNTRDKLKVSAGESFGFFASSLTVKLKYSPKDPFWKNARKVHSNITRELNHTNPFKMLSADLIHPTLLDSLYFQKYGSLDVSITQKMLNKMGWSKVTYGYALTNVGRLNIPTQYGSMTLEGVYGPLFYSDVEEKMVGVITVGDQLTFLHGSNESLIGDAAQFREISMNYLKEAMKK